MPVDFDAADPMQNLGVVYVQPEGNVPPLRTLFAFNHPRFGMSLVNRVGVTYTPKSPSVGYVSRPGYHQHKLVCDDDVSPETFEQLKAAGYPVLWRG